MFPCLRQTDQYLYSLLGPLSPFQSTVDEIESWCVDTCITGTVWSSLSDLRSVPEIGTYHLLTKFKAGLLFLCLCNSTYVYWLINRYTCVCMRTQVGVYSNTHIQAACLSIRVFIISYSLSMTCFCVVPYLLSEGFLTDYHLPTQMAVSEVPFCPQHLLLNL